MLYIALLLALYPLQQAWGLPVLPNSNTSEAAPCYVSGIKYLHSQQISREDPCDFCMCLDGEVFCWWQQQCLNTTQQPTNTTDTGDWDEETEGSTAHSSGGVSTDPPPTTCTVMGVEYKVGEVLPRETGTCLQCECGKNARVSCSPKDCAGPDQFRPPDQQSLDMFDVDVF